MKREPGVVDVLEENEQIFDVFLSLQTQWRMAGMAGAMVGLEYAAIPAVLQLRGIRRREWPEIFEGLRVMEAAAIPVLAERQKS